MSRKQAINWRDKTHMRTSNASCVHAMKHNPNAATRHDQAMTLRRKVDQLTLEIARCTCPLRTARKMQTRDDAIAKMTLHVNGLTTISR